VSKDANGKMWLLPGDFSPFNDLWRYDPANNLWTWMAGDSIKNSSGSYGTKGTASITNSPQSRDYYNFTWMDSSNNLVLFGGMKGSNPLNDLWKYNSSSNEWAWLNGDSIGVITGTYGTKGIAVPKNKPSPRHGSVAWTDDSSNLWLFGGQGNLESKVGQLNDL